MRGCGLWQWTRTSDASIPVAGTSASASLNSAKVQSSEVIFRPWSLSVVCVGGDEGLVLFTEDSPILDLALDTSGSCHALWVATTATHVNKWPVDPSKANGFNNVEGAGSSEEEEGGITYIDEPAPIFSQPIAVLPGQVHSVLHLPILASVISPPPPSPLSLSPAPSGGSSIKEYRILANRHQVLTKDSEDEVVRWDVLHVCLYLIVPSHCLRAGLFVCRRVGRQSWGRWTWRQRLRAKRESSTSPTGSPWRSKQG